MYAPFYSVELEKDKDWVCFDTIAEVRSYLKKNKIQFLGAECYDRRSIQVKKPEHSAVVKEWYYCAEGVDFVIRVVWPIYFNFNAPSDSKA